MTSNPYPIRFKPDERAMLKELAQRLNRTEPDTVRVLVRSALEVLREEERSVEKTQQVELSV